MSETNNSVTSSNCPSIFEMGHLRTSFTTMNRVLTTAGHPLHLFVQVRASSQYRTVPKAKTQITGTILKVLGAGLIISTGFTLHTVYDFLETRKYATLDKVQSHLPKPRRFQRDRPDVMYTTLNRDFKNTFAHMKTVRSDVEPTVPEEVREQYKREAREEVWTLVKALLFRVQRPRAKEILLEVEAYVFTPAEIAERKKRVQ